METRGMRILLVRGWLRPPGRSRPVRAGISLAGGRNSSCPYRSRVGKSREPGSLLIFPRSAPIYDAPPGSHGTRTSAPTFHPSGPASLILEHASHDAGWRLSHSAERHWLGNGWGKDSKEESRQRNALSLCRKNCGIVHGNWVSHNDKISHMAPIHEVCPYALEKHQSGDVQG